jgi:hypothetical protein
MSTVFPTPSFSPTRRVPFNITRYEPQTPSSVSLASGNYLCGTIQTPISYKILSCTQLAVGCTPRSCLSACRADTGCTPHTCVSPFHASTVSLPSRLVYDGIAQIPRSAASAYSIDAMIYYACVGSLGSVRQSTTRERSCTTKCGAVVAPNPLFVSLGQKEWLQIYELDFACSAHPTRTFSGYEKCNRECARE